MDMEINATLIVQAFHFFCAYLMFRFLLFKPAVAAIKELDDEKRTLLSAIKSRETAAINLEQKRQEQWAEFKDSIKNDIPPIDQKKDIVIEMLPELSFVEPTQHEIQQLVKTVVPDLIKKVDHVGA